MRERGGEVIEDMRKKKLVLNSRKMKQDLLSKSKREIKRERERMCEIGRVSLCRWLG